MAVLVAERLQATQAVVTVAANLDHRRWAQLHGYDRLKGSLEPDAGALRKGIYQLHLVGSEDRNIPPGLLRAALGDARDTLKVVDGYDHRCCWEKLWPSVLERVAPALGSDRAPR